VPHLYVLLSLLDTQLFIYIYIYINNCFVVRVLACVLQAPHVLPATVARVRRHQHQLFVGALVPLPATPKD
jgi:hypothetical protein